MTARKGFPLRLDPKLYEELRRWAAAEFRSINGQIEYILRDATGPDGAYIGSKLQVFLCTFNVFS